MAIYNVAYFKFCNGIFKSLKLKVIGEILCYGLLRLHLAMTAEIIRTIKSILLCVIAGFCVSGIVVCVA
ncbi:hypothetical protein [Helicobacter rodentium]|uniref:hypothetical protein n=1 Tax=Helicobacter rodentium TaxID=59617 RepID=UPI0012EC3037|nr:hypothetical protein [Helicobacter rodentium]